MKFAAIMSSIKFEAKVFECEGLAIEQRQVAVLMVKLGNSTVEKMDNLLVAITDNSSFWITSLQISVGHINFRLAIVKHFAFRRFKLDSNAVSTPRAAPCR